MVRLLACLLCVFALFGCRAKGSGEKDAAPPPAQETAKSEVADVVDDVEPIDVDALQTELASLRQQVKSLQLDVADLQSQLTAAQQANQPQVDADTESGFLTVHTHPEHAQVYVSGKLIGPAPIERMVLPSKKHGVRVYWEAHKKFSETQWTVLTAGGDNTLSFALDVVPEGEKVIVKKPIKVPVQRKPDPPPEPEPKPRPDPVPDSVEKPTPNKLDQPGKLREGMKPGAIDG